MPIDILMPALSPTMTHGKLAKWLVKEGDKIASGTVIAEIETDKATMEYELADDGVLAKILVAAGTDNVAVNTPIAVLLAEGESAGAVAAAKPPARPAKATPPSPQPSPASARGGVATVAARPSPAGRERVPSVSEAGEGRVFASPLARRLAAQVNVDLARLAGSGPHGRIVKADVETARAAGAPPRPSAPAPAAPPYAPATESYTEIPLGNIRKITARRLSEAKQTIPHFYLTIHCELDELLALRAKLNARTDSYKLSVNDFVIRAAALALVKVPDANAAWGGDKLLKFDSVDISVAVAIEGGLITPIIRRAHAKGLAEISNEMKDLAARAKAGKLKPEEFQGGGFSISNLGMFGISEFAAVINPPQASILAVGAAEPRAVVKQGGLGVATMMTCTLSCDHRVIDGVLGAQFLAAFKGYIEEPLTMLL